MSELISKTSTCTYRPHSKIFAFDETGNSILQEKSSRKSKAKKKRHSKKSKVKSLELSKNLKYVKRILKSRNEFRSEVEMMSKLKKKLEKRYKHQMTKFLKGVNTKEVPVDFEVPSLHSQEKVTTLKLNEKKELRKIGIEIRDGAWSKEESKKLSRNWKKFKREFRVINPVFLLGLNLKGFEKLKKRKFLKFLKAKHFYLRLGEGLNNRDLGSIYTRARVQFHPYRNSGRMNKKERKILLQLHELFGNRWNIISNLMRKTAKACQQSYDKYIELKKKGTWTRTNRKKLIEMLEDMDIADLDDAVWLQISKVFASNSPQQCRYYYLNNVLKRKDVVNANDVN